MEIINFDSALLIVFTYIISFLIFLLNKIDKKIFHLLFFWHLFFCLVYYLYSLNYEADSHSYYNSSLEKFADFGTGAVFVVNFTRFFSYFLDLSYFNCFFIFNFIGTIGILFFYLALREVNFSKKVIDNKLFIVIMFLPTMHFWSSAIGKDVFSFLAITIFVWSSLNLKNRKNYIILSIVLMFLVRPHISTIMSTSVVISLIFYSNIDLKNKILYLAFLGTITLFIANYAFVYVGMPDLINYSPFKINIQILFDFVNNREIKHLSVTGGIDISSMGPLMKIFTYLYRPLPFEIKNFFQLVVSVENILLIYFTIIGFIGLFKNNNNNNNLNVNQSKLLLFVYIFLSMIILSFTSANFGINSRQKWMIFPAILILVYQFSIKNYYTEILKNKFKI